MECSVKTNALRLNLEKPIEGTKIEVNSQRNLVAKKQKPIGEACLIFVHPVNGELINYKLTPEIDAMSIGM